MKAPNVTAGEWEVVPLLNVKWNSPDKIESVVYEIRGGEKSGPFENKGLFHPSNATYYVHEHTVASAELFDSTWYCGGIENEADAKMLAASKKLAEALQLCYDHCRLYHPEVETNNVGEAVREALYSAGYTD